MMTALPKPLRFGFARCGRCARAHSAVPLRPPETVMRLARLGSFHQTRLSFMRVLLRTARPRRLALRAHALDVDARGEGVAIYRATGPARSYSLVCFAHDLPPEKRTDRVIAEEWDAAFALFDGDPSDGRYRAACRQCAAPGGGPCERSRDRAGARQQERAAVRSVVATCLAAGRQPAAGRTRRRSAI